MELLKVLWSNYLSHIFDILIVTYIFYRIILLIKGTRAVQIILGILILVVITFLANEVLHLQSLSWLLGKFWLAAVLILIVVFQPEIRSALAQLGSQKWGKIIMPHEMGFINEIIDAVKECSERQIGALIVLQQDTGLKTYVETGITIRGQVSKELIISIFNPLSPLHDGAVIIKGELLVAAGCVLPLSHEPMISKILGTRHRASIGLSEISDAIVVVVSEETGWISLAREGQLERNVNPDDLRKRLREIYKNVEKINTKSYQ